MTTTQFTELLPVPKWYISNFIGQALSGGYLRTLSSQDNTLINPVYQDAGFQLPWPYIQIPNQGVLTGIQFDATGSQGPFYFLFDTAYPQDLYYLEVYDSNGILQWTIDDFGPIGGGGGSVINQTFNIQNLIANSVFYRNLGLTPIDTSGTYQLRLAPSSHAGLSNDVNGSPAHNTSGLYTGPDIYLVKNNVSCVDSVAFPKFTLGDEFTNDIAPVDYFEYKCTAPGASENVKCLQIPINQGVQNLSNKVVTISFFGKSAGSSTVTLNWLQFFGDGTGASSPGAGPVNLVTSFATQALTPTWAKYTLSTTVPDVTGGNLGSPNCNNDALFLQIQFPLDATCTVDITKPCLYLGNISAGAEFQTYDEIDAVMSTARTGHVESSLDTIPLPGYVAMDDGTIGNAASGSSNRANNDTFPLYNFLWTGVTSQTGGTNVGGTGYAQLYDSAGAALSTVGASAAADFIANKRIGLIKALGRVLGGAGASTSLTSAHALGQYVGEESHTLSIAEMPSHNHPGSVLNYNQKNSGSTSDNVVDNASPNSQIALSIAAQGGGAAHNIIQPTMFMNFYIKL